MATSRAWGIDIGNRALKAVRLSREGDGYRVDDFDIIEHETPLSQAGDNRDTLVNNALLQFVNRHKTGSIPVGIAVSGQQSFARFIKLPPVEEKKIPEIVRFEAIQQIPFPLDDVEWSYQLFRKQDDPDVEVGIFAMRRELVNRYVSNYTDVSLNVQVVQMSPLAVYNALAFDQKLDGTTLIIDMGAETTDLVVADGESVWHRSIPIGGNNFTETLVRGFKLDFAKAEAMKREASTSKYARQIFQAMRPVFADLVAEIQRSVGFYASTHSNAKLKKVIALGGTFKLPGLQKYLQQNLTVDVERLESFTAAPPTDARLLALYQENVISAGTAYGLAVQGLGEAKIVSSLLPSHIKHEKIWRDKTKWFVASAGLFVLGAGVALAGGYLPKLAYEAADSDSARSSVQTVYQQAQKLDEQWSKIQSSGETERATIKNIRSLEADRGLWAQIVRSIHDALPPDSMKDAAQLKSVPRAQRQVIHLSNWKTAYMADIGVVLADLKRDSFASKMPVETEAPPQQSFRPMGAGGGGGGPSMGGPPAGAQIPDWVRNGMGPPGTPRGPGARPPISFGSAGSSSGDSEIELSPVPPEIVTAATKKPGFVVRIEGITPNGNAAGLLDDTFLKSLLKGRFAGTGTPPDFYVADAFMVKRTKLSENSQRMTEILRAHNALEQYKTPVADANAAAGGRVVVNAAPDDNAAFLDPATNEDIRNDYEFVVLAFVVIGQPPAAPTTQAATEAAPAAAPATPPAP